MSAKQLILHRALSRLGGLALVLILVACGTAPTTQPPVPPTNRPSPLPSTEVPTLPSSPTQALTEPASPTEAPATAAPTAVTGLQAADVVTLLNDKFTTVNRDLALWNIQPGLGTVMMEYGNRLARMWFAANADNWDMAKYQLDEMTEIQEVGETTRPNRAPMLKAFEDSSLSGLDDAILAKDKTAFTTAFNSAITGCNACHKASTGTNWNSYQFVEIQVPNTDPASYIDWKGAGQDNYIANPPAGQPSATATAPTGTLDAAGVQQLVDAEFNQVDRSLPLWNIQPGLGTVMMEYGNRLSRLWFAAQAGNWDMAKYQLGEALEIQEVGETTRPNRAPLLKAFEDSYLTPLDQAIDAQDQAGFTTAFNTAVEGCNACHTASSGSEWKSYKFVKIQVPTADNNDYLVWNAAKSTGNFIANPPTAATSTPKPVLTGTLDKNGVEELINTIFNTVDRSLALWNIQPGLGTVMIEYGKRLAQIKFALDAGNWDMAKYQLDEMIEIQEVGETTRPNRAPLLKAFEDSYLSALDQAILAQDASQADSAFTNAITGCNACHAASTGSEWSSFGFVQIQPPQSDPADYIHWLAANGTGNYKP